MVEWSEVAAFHERYVARARDGGAWTMQAITLCDAADELFRKAEEGSAVFNRLFIVDGSSGELSVRRGELPVDDISTLFAVQYAGIALMLLGMGIEAQVKAMLVEQRPELVHEHRARVKPEFATHDLVGLLCQCDVDLSPEQERVLDTVTLFVRWAGRYPVPLRAGMPAVADDEGDDETLGPAPIGWARSLWVVARPFFDDVQELDERRQWTKERAASEPT